MKNFITKRFVYTYFLFTAMLLSMGFATTVFSQAKDSKGTDFWLMFDKNVSTPALTLFITSDVNTSGTVTIPGLGFSSAFTVTANTVTSVSIPVSAATHTSGVADDKGIHITSLQEVTVYGLNYAPFTTDAYLGLPTDVLGTDYIVLTYSGQSLSEFGIVATVNGTTININQSVTAGGHAQGVPYSITLNQGQTFEIGGGSDLTGTTISSNKPIGVMGANGCANIPPGYSYCDHICEMVPPTTTWGKKFGVVPLKARTNGDTWRFLAAEDNTVVKINGVAQPAINRGKYVEKVITAQSVVESDKKILAAQFANGSTFSGNPGDPFMMLIPPLEQFLAKYTVTTVSGYVAHYINLIAPNAIVGSLKLDGVAVATAEFTPIGSSGFSGAKLTVSPGTHNLIGTLPFGVFIYGFNTDDSYGYPGGQSFSEIAKVISLAVTPETGTAPVGTEQCFDGLAKDQFGNPVPGVRVDFDITGVNPGSSGFAFTNASGVAHFCYTGTNAGTDNIKGSVGTINDAPSTFNWTSVLVKSDYYSKAAGDLHNVLSWGVNADGSGATPPDFGTGKTFHLANRVPNYILTANFTVGGKLDIPSGSQLQIGSNTLSVADLIGTGSIAGTQTSNLIVTTPSAGNTSLNFISSAKSLNSLIILSSSVTTVSNALNIYGVLSINSGTLNTGNNITLKSTAANTARVAPVTGTVTGTVTAERYIPARRAWRILSAPVGGTQTISAAWQEGATTSSVNPDPNPGYGTHITEGTTSGFDHNPLVSMPSIKKYISATNTWVPLTNTNATGVNADAYMTFVRGHRATPLGYNTVPATNTTLRSTGALKTGNQTFAISATGFTAVPNPFASPINYATITRTNVPNNFYLWDPKLGGTSGVGGYVLVSFNGISYDITPAPVSAESQYIQSGQGFLVQSTGVAGSLVIKESDKSATASSNVFRNASTTKGIRFSLQVMEANKSTATVDEAFTSYSAAYSNRVDAMDPVKLPNINENLAIEREQQSLMIERRAVFTGNDTISLRLWNTVERNYLLQISPENLSQSGIVSGYLEDKYLKIITPISLSEVTRVNFSVDGNAGSSAKDRFRIILTGKNVQAGEIAFVKSAIKLSSNPVTGKSLGLQFVNQPAGTYSVTLFNNLGQKTYQGKLIHAGGTATQTLQFTNHVVKGLYRMHVASTREFATAIIPLIVN